uniref:RPGF2 n=1 Tax=Plectus sambesii TaxID=2011161 RepID=A0A914XL56_9BILA
MTHLNSLTCPDITLIHLIDYPDVQHIPVAIHHAEQSVLSAREARRGVQSMNLDHVVMSSGRLPNSSNFAAAATPTGSNGSTPTSTLRRAPHASDTCGITASTSGALPPPKGLPRSYETGDFTRLPQDADSTVCNKRSDVYLNGAEEGDDPSACSSAASTASSQIQQIKVKHRPSKSSSSSDTRERLRVKSTASSTTTEGDDALAGLPEAAVDSEDEDEESCPSHDSFHELKDNVRECLEKEPHERNEDDLSILLDFMQHMPALSNLPMSVKRELCLKMVFAVVPEAGSIVMNDNEPFDSWSVIVNGQVEVSRPDGQRILYSLGDSFGVEPVPDIQYHQGTMRTIVDDCEFVLVEHKDYCSIMSKVNEHIEKHADKITGEIVSETEKRTVDNHHGYVLIKGKADKLISHLVEERDTAVDPHYVDDLLLMYRAFIQDPVMIFEKLAHWFGEQSLKDKVARIVLLWVNNHFNDFETNVDMMKLLERFEQALERENMQSQQALLNIACSVKSRTRTVTYTRSNREEVLHFSILGGPPGVYGIFVSKVEEASQAEKVGLKRGDEVC